MNIITIGSDINLLKEGSRVYNRVREYAKLVDAYTVFVFTKNQSDANIIDGNFKVIAVYDRNKLLQIIRLFVLLRREKNNFLSSSNIILSSQDPFEIGLLSWFATKIFGFRFHVQVHTEFFSPLFKRLSFRNRMQSIIAPFVLKRARSIRVVSKKILSFLVETLYIQSHVTVAPIYIKRQEMPLVQKDENLIISISRLEPEKNFFRMIKAFEQVAVLNRLLRLEIYGEGSEKTNILKLIDQSPVKQRISLKGFVSNPFEIIARARVFLISSDFEGYAVTAVESVMSGTPVCMTPVGCAHEFIVNCINGFVSPDFSPNNLAKTLERTLLFSFESKVLNKSLDSLLSQDEYYSRLVSSWRHSC